MTLYSVAFIFTKTLSFKTYLGTTNIEISIDTHKLLTVQQAAVKSRACLCNMGYIYRLLRESRRIRFSLGPLEAEKSI